ncbi:hypothetical protein [Streptomyces sp. NPDC048172]|uniref:hypothetical protein n=1 Tax=Streptomyces sp. NPDC048172 TaxID=3365505 RepID=UPI00371FC5E8
MTTNSDSRRCGDHMSWTAKEFGASHEGVPVALLADGSEPKPVYFDAGSGGGGKTVSDWWIYDGQSRAPLATHLRSSCACGWRGEQRYVLDWSEMIDSPCDIDISGPREDWKRHIEEVRARTVPLPVELEALLERLEQQISALADDAPLAALRAVAALERITEDIAPHAACAAEADDLSWSTIATALGLTEKEAQSRLLHHQLKGMGSRRVRL